MTRSVLITGGLGYVGGRIAEALARNPEFDITVTTRDPGTSERPDWLHADRCARLDMLNDAEIADACRNADVIIHCAALNEIDSLRDPERAILVNVLGTQKLVAAAESAGVGRFIYFSTAHIYRAPLEGVITEATVPRPVHPYAITHRAAEDLVLAATTRQTMTGIVLRLSNSIGAPINSRVNRWSLAGNDLCRQAVTDGEIRLKTSGLQQRDFVPLSDVARAAAHMCRLPAAQFADGCFNLGGGQAISIADLAGRIRERCGALFGTRPPVVRPEPLPSERAGSLTYSIEKLKSTGFSLAGSLDQEIDDTLRFCRRYCRNPASP
jgi:UDP-glucose 4-epimerase